MRLTDYIKGLGRPLAYYPNLKIITGSTTASILLCQLLYWTDKTTDGWIYKTHYDLEEETGLTYYEQKTARRILRNLGILKEQFKRLDHTNRYKINQKVLNELWEKAHGEIKAKEEKITLQEPEDLDDYKDPDLLIPRAQPKKREIPEKKGDMVDGMIEYGLKSKGFKKEQIKNEIKDKLYNLLHINVDGNMWKDFIEYAYQRQVHHGEPVDQFISWAIKSGWNPIFWTPAKCQSFYPQAFLKQNKEKEFIEPLPEKVDEEYDPMPEDLKPKKRLY